MEEHSLEGINEALKDGKILYAFRSSMAVRVAQIEDFYHGPNRGHGEGSSLIEALQNASKDYLAKGKHRQLGYGCGGCQIDDTLDGWVLVGHGIAARKGNKGITLEATATNQTETGYKPVIKSVARDTFAEAYAALCKLINKKTHSEFSDINQKYFFESENMLTEERQRIILEGFKKTGWNIYDDGTFRKTCFSEYDKSLYLCDYHSKILQGPTTKLVESQVYFVLPAVKDPRNPDEVDEAIMDLRMKQVIWFVIKKGTVRIMPEDYKESLSYFTNTIRIKGERRARSNE